MIWGANKTRGIKISCQRQHISGVKTCAALKIRALPTDLNGLDWVFGLDNVASVRVETDVSSVRASEYVARVKASEDTGSVRASEDAGSVKSSQDTGSVRASSDIVPCHVSELVFCSSISASCLVKIEYLRGYVTLQRTDLHILLTCCSH